MDIDYIPEERYLWLIISILKKYVSTWLNIEVHDGQVLILNSSGLNKLSFHIIIRLLNEDDEELMFKNNIICGKFVKKILQDLYEQTYKQGNIDNLQSYQNSDLEKIIAPDGHSCIDKQVYNKNQAFRIFMSKKLGCERELLFYKNCHYEVKSKYEIFEHAFITIPIRKKCIEIDFDQDEKGEEQKCKFNALDSNTDRNLEFYKEAAEELNNYVQLGRIIMIKKISDCKFVARTNSRFCEYKLDLHKHNHTYLMIYIKEENIVFRCFNEECKQMKHIRHELPNAIKNFLNDGDVNEQMYNISIDGEVIV